MKRWVALLALLNVLLAGLVLTAGSPDQPATATRGQEDERLEHDNLRVQRSADPTDDEQTDDEQTDADTATAESCLFLGPAATPGELDPTREQLQDNETEVVTQAVSDDPLWWVYIAPAESPEVARNRLSALQERGIESFRVPDGEFANAISLGYFRSQENAERLHAEYRDRGIEADLERLPQTREEYWLKVVLPQGTSASSTESVAAGTDVNAVDRPCDWPDDAG